MTDNNLNSIKFKIGYKINETPRYRKLIDNGEVFDEIPNEMEEQDENLPDPNKRPEGGEQVEPSNDQPVGLEMPEPDTENQQVDDNVPEPAFANKLPSNEPPVPTEQSVDEIQNEIIKHNIEAMKSIHQELENLNKIVNGLGDKFNTLTNDVEEVREPTDVEKLMNKSEVSYPYYFNLNDMWSDNWFTQNREKEKSRGIKELPDGTYIADFDDLKQYSDQDINNSF